jgi:hypothetical protein
MENRTRTKTRLLVAGTGAAFLAVGWIGSELPAGGAPLLAQQVAGEDPRARELVDRWIEAVGGMQRYWELEGATFTLTTELYDPATGRMKRARPRYVTVARTSSGEISRIERWEGDDFIQQGWDGERVWAVTNGEALGPGDKDFDEVRYVASDVQYWISLPYKLRDPGVNLHYDGIDEEGREVVRVTFGEGVGDHQDVWRYRFGAGSVWPVQVEYTEEGKSNVNRLRFEDIQTVDGYVFVGRRVHFDADGGLTKVLDTRGFRFNPDLDLAVFSRR